MTIKSQKLQQLKYFILYSVQLIIEFNEIVEFNRILAPSVAIAKHYVNIDPESMLMVIFANHNLMIL